MQRVSWFLKISALSMVALIMAVATLGNGYSASASAAAAATTAATAGAAAPLPLCYKVASIAKVRIVHASPNSPAVDVYLDGATTPAIVGLAYGKAFPADGSYMDVASGTHHITVTETKKASNKLFDQDWTATGMMAYTVVAEGTVADKNFTLMSYVDDASDTGGKVRLSVIHAVPDAGAGDLVNTADGKVWVSNLAYQASAEANIDAPAKPVNLDVTKTGDAKTIWLSLKNQKLAADSIYTIIVAGLTGANKTDKAVKLSAIILTSKSIAGFAAPPTPTPVATVAAATAAATMNAAATMAATTAAAAPTKAATVAATTAPTATVNPTTIPVGQQPASAGVALRTSKLVHLNDGKCVEVAGITLPGGPAAVAGLATGDIILGVDGKALATAADFEKILAKHKSGDAITLAVQKAGTSTETDVKVTLGLNPFS